MMQQCTSEVSCHVVGGGEDGGGSESLGTGGEASEGGLVGLGVVDGV